MPGSKLLFVSYDGLIADIAWQVTREGHQAKLWIQDEDERGIADGLAPKCDDWRREVDWADVVVFDDVLGMGAWADELRRAGKPVVGGSPYTDKLEDDRAFGQAELKAAGVSIIPQENFTGFDDAIEYVRKNPNRYVIKPSGEAAELQAAALRRRGRRRARRGGGARGLQAAPGRRRSRTSSCSAGSWASRWRPGASSTGRSSSRRSASTFEHKKLFPGDIGQADGRDGHGDVPGASPTRSSTPRRSRWKRSCARSATSATSTSTAS